MELFRGELFKTALFKVETKLFTDMFTDTESNIIKVVGKLILFAQKFVNAGYNSRLGNCSWDEIYST